MSIKGSKKLDSEIIKGLGMDLYLKDEIGHWVVIKEGEDASLFRPSENMKDAFISLDILQKKDRLFSAYLEMRVLSEYSGKKEYVCELTDYYGEFSYIGLSYENMQLAICDAIVKYVEEREEREKSYESFKES